MSRLRLYKWEYWSTMWKIKHYVRHEKKVNEHKVLYYKALRCETIKNNKQLYSFMSNLQTYYHFHVDKRSIWSVICDAIELLNKLIIFKKRANPYMAFYISCLFYDKLLYNALGSTISPSTTLRYSVWHSISRAWDSPGSLLLAILSS